MTEKQVSIEEVVVEGNRRTNVALFDTVLQQAYAATNFTDLANSLAVALNKLKGLDIFEKVEILLDDQKKITTLDDSEIGTKLRIKVEEKSSVLIKAGTYLEGRSVETGAEATIGLRNPLGNGETLTFQTSHGARNSSRVQFDWTKPFFYNLPASLSVLFNHGTTNFLKSSSYQEKLTEAEVKLSGASTSLSYCCGLRDILPQSRSMTSDKLGLFEPGKETTLFPQYNCSPDVLSQSKPNVKSCLKYSGRVDLGATKCRVNLEYAGLGLGGESNFIKSSVETQRIEELFFGSVAAFSLRFGYLLPFDKSRSDNVGAKWSRSGTHLSDRFFVGGPLQLRGFESRGVGPHSPNFDSSKIDSIGGEVMWSSGFSLGVPLGISTSDTIGLQALFYLNAGNCSEYGSSWRTILYGARVSCGVGLLLPSPVGRLEATYSLVARSNAWDAIDRFQIGVGLNFL